MDCRTVHLVMSKPFWALLAVSVCLLTACSATEPMIFQVSVDAGTVDTERCDGIDNNKNGLVDETFKDAGIYLHNGHCGACNKPCVPDAVTEEISCVLTDAGPACRVETCKQGYEPIPSSTCVPRAGWLCRPCLADAECGGFSDAVCKELYEEKRCTVLCDSDLACPLDYICNAKGFCLPPSGSCRCGVEDNFEISCTVPVNGELCLGKARCENGKVTPCTGSKEVCDGVDNDCDGVVDQPYVDERGVYNVDLKHCGACGIDCTLNDLTNFEIICGGHETSPVCAILCRDVQDGIQVGDFVDADLGPENGCECEVLSLDDEPGNDFDGVIDANCDGADGVVAESFYVIPTGDDSAAGSPHRPYQTVQAAVDAASASLSTNFPRPFVYVASGAYREVLHLKEGVHVYGGYRPDFLERDTRAYVTEIVAPRWEDVTGGAALVAVDFVTEAKTRANGIIFTGASAPEGRQYAFGAYLRQVGENLALQELTISAGDGAHGENGADGLSGAVASTPGTAGEPQKIALEDDEGTCVRDLNLVRGGLGAVFACDDIGVSGGDGGNASCATNTDTTQESGTPGSGYDGVSGGAGGSGGWDVIGPLDEEHCGFADFRVSGNHEIAADGAPGENGHDGEGGEQCIDSMGEITANGWLGDFGSQGESGSPGAGGGGGGAGSSARIEGTASCPYADGIGGGGGGGGAGGCGGDGGSPGTSGGPSVGVVIFADGSTDIPQINDVTIRTGSGGDGGSGGHGGDGGNGGAGGPGGELSVEERLVPSLAGPDKGGYGGSGGAGGLGGGGGGGCGGSSIGIWIVSENGNSAEVQGAVTEYRTLNIYELGLVGSGGAGGMGGNAGADGLLGEVIDVISP